MASTFLCLQKSKLSVALNPQDLSEIDLGNFQKTTSGGNLHFFETSC